jgi:CRP-like cAMP-binding protein
MALLKNFQPFKTYLRRHALINYNDDVNIFLRKVLEQVPYLRDLQTPQKQEIMMHIAISFEPIFYEADYRIFNVDLNSEEQVKDEMVIIYSGLAKASIDLDGSNQELTFDYLGKGSIVRPYHFMSNRKHSCNLKTIEPCIVFRLFT